MRRYQSLAGSWQFQVDPEGALTLETLAPDREITVPLPWQAAFPELQKYSGYAWYRRSFDLDEEWLRGELLLRFGAVDYWCQVFVNGRLAGEHEGGYTPFALPVRSLVQPGSNEIAVRVYDPAQSSIITPRWPNSDASPKSKVQSPKLSGPPFDADDIPHGKQEWYVNVGGIWQEVALAALHTTYVGNVKVTPDPRTGRVKLQVELEGQGAIEAEGSMIRANISGSNQPGAEYKAQLTPGQSSLELSLDVKEPRLWSLEDPYLYTATVTLDTPSGEDEVAVRFGFREISTRDGKILLNGEPIFLLAALDQDLYPGTIYTVPSEEFLRDQFRKAKELGLNCLRCHIKPPDPLYLDLADEMGLLVWAEIPSWRTFHTKGTMHPGQIELGEEIKQRVEETLREMVRRDYNHPSLVIWTIVNEDWGTALPLSAHDREWVSRMYDLCKSLDPTRLVVDNSACPAPWGPNIHVKSDLDDFHVYANIPDQARSFVHAIEQFNLRPIWTYSSHGDTERTGSEPLVLSEFGNWGLPSVKTLKSGEPGGQEPDWFKLGPWWSSWEGEPGWPMGAVERFEKLGLSAIWPDFEEFAKATQRHEFAALKFEIEAMRRQPALAGYVITEFTDAYWESNGLLDFNRNPKVFHDDFAQINAPDVVIPQMARYAYWDDEKPRVHLHVSHYSPAEWGDAQVRVTLGEETGAAAPVGRLERGEVRDLGWHALRLPSVEAPANVTYRLDVRASKGQEVARNTFDLLVLPVASRQPRYRNAIAVVTLDDLSGSERADLSGLPTEETGEPFEPAEELGLSNAGPDAGPMLYPLRRSLGMIGYRVSRRITAATKLAVTNYPTAEMLRWVRDGGDLLFISEGPSPFFWVQSRRGTYGGSWINNFSWLRPEVHRRLKVDNPLTLPFMRVMPQGTILGLPVEDRAVQSDFLAGMIGGWVAHPAVHTVQFRYGGGRVIMTTFNLEETLPTGPVAVAMLHDLIEHLASDECRPTLRANY